MQTKATPLTIDEYILSQPFPLHAPLEELRCIIRKAAPEAEEVISYSMPAFRFHDMLVYFAGYSGHIGFYPMPSGITKFKAKMGAYKLSKATIQFPLDKPLPVKLITDIVKFRVKENLELKAIKDAKKKTKK